jgi:peptidoglycan/xylan/chitin deacetylase (PgdA/CDA1 family)
MRRLLDLLHDLSGIPASKWRQLPPAVYVFNFHRVGNDSGDAFHPNIFSCTGRRFAEIIGFLRREFVIIGEDRLIELIESGAELKRKYAVITLDDGYADNYEIAFPVLRDHSCEAIFFIASDFVGSDCAPWWDRIAWRVYNRGDGEIKVLGSNDRISVRRNDLAGSIRRVLRAVKDNAAYSLSEKVVDIERQVSCDDLAHSNPQLFMDWDNLRDIVRHGIAVGSHTRGHEILSHLTEREQEFELTESKRVIESQLGKPVRSVAYPVGSSLSYSARTLSLVASAGYQLGFNFLPHINGFPLKNRFEISRIGVDNNPSTRDLQRQITGLSDRPA